MCSQCWGPQRDVQVPPADIKYEQFSPIGGHCEDRPAHLLINLSESYGASALGQPAPEFLGANVGPSAPMSAHVSTHIVTSLVLARHQQVKTADMTRVLISDIRF